MKGNDIIRWHVSIYQYSLDTVAHPIMTTSSWTIMNFRFLSIVQNAIMTDIGKYFDEYQAYYMCSLYLVVSKRNENFLVVLNNPVLTPVDFLHSELLASL